MFHKQNARQPLAAALLALLLALTSAFSCIGLSGWESRRIDPTFRPPSRKRGK